VRDRSARSEDDGKLWDLAVLFTELGFVAFGGLAAHMPMMRLEGCGNVVGSSRAYRWAEDVQPRIGAGVDTGKTRRKEFTMTDEGRYEMYGEAGGLTDEEVYELYEVERKLFEIWRRGLGDVNSGVLTDEQREALLRLVVEDIRWLMEHDAPCEMYGRHTENGGVESMLVFVGYPLEDAAAHDDGADYHDALCASKIARLASIHRIPGGAALLADAFPIARGESAA
jgi:hypothetical protein